MKNYTKEFAAQFKQSYIYKMGGTQTIELPNGQQFEYDDREYYSGRGSKYNGSIRHDIKGLIKVSRKELSAALKATRERKARIKQMESERAAAEKKYADNKAAGVYGLRVEDWGTFVELSEEERRFKYFSHERLAKTLNISVQDAALLDSPGKTYVFARKLDGTGVLELYHPSLDCNYLSISVIEASPERIAKFNHDEWASAPYAGLLGQTEHKNHFVC